ncbi:DUF2200 family protein [Corynebacterium gerontici]|nr:DUF2200 family protein [Corynebacterium gerontici]
MTFGELYPTYLQKIERKGRKESELQEVLAWLFAMPRDELASLNDASLGEIFSTRELNEAADKITGSVCGVKVHLIEDPVMRGIRYADKLVDELAKGKAVEKIKRD